MKIIIIIIIIKQESNIALAEIGCRDPGEPIVFVNDGYYGDLSSTMSAVSPRKSVVPPLNSPTTYSFEEQKRPDFSCETARSKPEFVTQSRQLPLLRAMLRSLLCSIKGGSELVEKDQRLCEAAHGLGKKKILPVRY